MCPGAVVHYQRQQCEDAAPDPDHVLAQYSDRQQLRNRKQTHHSAHTVCGCRTNRMVIWVCCCIDSAITLKENTSRNSVYYDSTVKMMFDRQM